MAHSHIGLQGLCKCSDGAHSYACNIIGPNLETILQVSTSWRLALKKRREMLTIGMFNSLNNKTKWQKKQ